MEKIQRTLLVLQNWLTEIRLDLVVGTQRTLQVAQYEPLMVHSGLFEIKMSILASFLRYMGKCKMLVSGVPLDFA